MDDQHYQQLVNRYLEGRCTEEELEVFFHLLKEGKLDTYLTEALDASSELKSEVVPVVGLDTRKNVFMPFWAKYAAAVLLIPLAVLLYVERPVTKLNARAVAVKPVINDALPGGNRAILTLANGKKVLLGHFGNGIIARQGAIKVDKVEDGHLVYQADPTGGRVQDAVSYNTVSTPRGGQYAVTLPDGSQAWLNSVSSITFPTAFNGNDRKVKITGEVYFEVAKDRSKPFFVESNGQTVKVLGTHFNINAYDDEKAVHTTLLEGSIEVTGRSGTKVLVPGQQAEVTDQHTTILGGADLQAAIAWKNGNFYFNHTDLPSLMRQLARWYDINIIYKGQTGDHEFVGQIKRSVRLSSVLRILEASGVQFTMEGKNLYIKP